MKMYLNKISFSATLTLILIAQVFLFAQTANAAGDQYFAQQGYSISLQGFSEELKEVNYVSPAILKLSDDSYIAVGGVEDYPKYGPASSSRVYFFTLESGIYKEARLPDGLTDVQAFIIDGNIYTFGGDGHLQDGLAKHSGTVYRYVESTNSFVIDSVGPGGGLYGWNFFQIDGHVRRLVLPSVETKNSEFTNGRVETYHPGLGWTAKEVPVAQIESFFSDILQRPSEKNGLNYWSYRYSEGMILEGIRKEFFKSEEYRLLFGRQEIAGFYRNILEREPDAVGWNYWAVEYFRGMSLDEIKSHFYKSDEYRQLSK